MDKELIKLSYKYCTKAYEINTDLGTTEYSFDITEYRDEPLQVLSIPGTNELLDWIKNLDIRSKCNVKKVAYEAAEDIYKRVMVDIRPDVPLLINGHSKGGLTALVYKRFFAREGDYCVSFCPARGFKGDIVLKNTFMVIDPDDIVPKLGWSLFNLPVTEGAFLPNGFGWSIRDHLLSSKEIKDFVSAL